MKTSNKLITGLLAAIFVATILFLAALKNTPGSNDDAKKVDTEQIGNK
jgi:preprotein translocase subunit SecG